jgi:hypothetical protein
MRVAIAGLAAMLCVAGCRNDQPLRSGLVTEPPLPSLTMRTLPKDASTICVASVRQRDALIAKPKTKTAAQDRLALDVLIDDVCR